MPRNPACLTVMDIFSSQKTFKGFLKVHIILLFFFNRKWWLKGFILSRQEMMHDSSQGVCPESQSTSRKKLLEENILSSEHIWSVTPEECLWEVPFLPAIWYLVQAWASYGVTARSCLKADGKPEDAGSLRRRSAPFCIIWFLGLVRMLPTVLHHTTQPKGDEIMTRR